MRKWITIIKRAIQREPLEWFAVHLMPVLRLPEVIEDALRHCSYVPIDAVTHRRSSNNPTESAVRLHDVIAQKRVPPQCLVWS